MTTEPEIEYLSEAVRLRERFLACDLASEGTAGAVYRAFASGAFYVVIDTRNVNSRFFAGLTGMKRRLVALRFVNRDAREGWLSEVLQGAKTASLAGNVLPGASGSGNSGAPLQPALYPPMNPKKRFDS
ncbi:MAG: hypothetical protein H7145_06335 [Akkermansiaceae bacterium]|nr:hypothetical protein [Armatimonadota bacterium]